MNRQNILIESNKMSLHINQNLNKINQIILYSQSYAAHKKMLNEAKPSTNSFSPERTIKN